MPDCLKPPKGVDTRTEVLELIETTPDSIARAVRTAFAPSRVHTEPESPYTVSLAIRTASSSSRNGITHATGPKISSRAARSSLETGARTVGGNQNPGPSGELPRIATGASPLAYEATFSRWSAEISGPI